MFQFILHFLFRLFFTKVIINTTNQERDISYYTNSNIISISPSGYFGFYTLGICAYIKEHYDTSSYLFTGTSAGSWNCLYITMKKFNIQPYIKHELFVNKSSYEILYQLKQLLENNCKTDIDLNRVFIGITTFHQANIHTEFEDLNDALTCCIASSNIPFITGSIFHRYRNAYSYDGIFSNCYLTQTPILHIHPNLWGQNTKLKFNLFKKDVYNLEELFKKRVSRYCYLWQTNTR